MFSTLFASLFFPLLLPFSSPDCTSLSSFSLVVKLVVLLPELLSGRMRTWDHDADQCGMGNFSPAAP